MTVNAVASTNSKGGRANILLHVHDELMSPINHKIVNFIAHAQNGAHEFEGGVWSEAPPLILLLVPVQGSWL